MADTGSGSGNAAPHPREGRELVGHLRAREAWSTALESGRIAHAWLLTGLQGVGKATFAYQAALEVLAGGARGRSSSGRDAIERRVRAATHGDLHVIENAADAGLAQTIPVEEVRELRNRLGGVTAAEAGWRVAIVDALDHLSPQGANALLKIVEEPPPRTVLFLIAHRARAVPATIRSRCRRLPFAALDSTECGRVLERLLPGRDARGRAGLARLAAGSPGRAATFARGDALDLLGEIGEICRPLPALDIAAAHAFSARVARPPVALRFATFAAMFRIWVYRAALRLVAGDPVAGEDIVEGEGEAQRQYGKAAGIAGVLALWNDVGRIADAAAGTNLDRRQAVLDVLLASRQQARGV